MRIEKAGSGIEDREAGYAELRQVLHTQSSILKPESPALDPAIKRIRWRARRGLLELDIVLERFITAQYEQLDDAEKMLFEVMLDMPDNPLWDMIAGRTDAENNEQQALLALIRSV